MKSIIGRGGRILGYLRESDDRIELIAPGGRLLGVYLKNDDMTVRPGGGLVGYGNLLLTLLED
ncbi:MAG TPA: hypothetical protein PKM73_07535 [Verrucomicrobiota bacterium]|nr:hypothetical protein [Verrucomicrobiota bacterium]HNU51260.1 hypothetical protein [Verrucomicrobiota bacterium]